jgi:hypothetical protein
MVDEWRAELDVDATDAFHRALDRLRERVVARDARHDLGGDVRISVDPDRIFAYTDTRERAEDAARVLSELAASHHLAAHVTIARWLHDEERWEPEQ